MKRLPIIPLGMPVKVTLDVPEVGDNLYLLALSVVDYKNTTKLAFITRYHIFTARELVDATERYYKNMDIVIGTGINNVLGHTYPITYNNTNGVMTTRWFCRFNGKCVEDLGDENFCALFSAREMRRSLDRTDLIYKQTFFNKFVQRLKSWMTQLVG